MSEQTTEYVYLIGSPDARLVKIGRSVNPEKRLADIQRMSPAPLMILWQHEGGSELETALHRRFKAHRTHGEWFDFGEDDPVSVVDASIIEMRTEALAKLEKPVVRRDLYSVIYRVGDKLLVMPGDEEQGCVALKSNGKKCNSWFDPEIEGLHWDIWIIPGIGTITGHNIDTEHVDRFLTQRCRKHYFDEPGTASYAEPAWEPFNLIRHANMILPVQNNNKPSYGRAIPPGFEEMAEQVRQFALTLIQETGVTA